MATEAANLFVKVTGDISDASKKLGQVGGMAEKTGGVLKGALSTAVGFGAATIGLNALGGAMGALKSGVIDMNASLETSTLQFTTLMGDSDKARKHVQSLFDFAAKTPFETGPIIQASRTMETFGGSALNTKENLNLFGDAAAAVSQPIDDVSFWMSRAYAAIQGGQPFGEARMRLMEMGIITPQVASEMENLQKQGASSTEVWGAMTGALGKFDGAMEKQAGTFDGMLSTFSDGVMMMLATAGKPLFDMLGKLLKGLNELMASPAFQGAMEAAAAALAAAFETLGQVISFVWGIVQPILSVIGDALGVLQGGADGLGASFEGMGAKLATAAQGVLSGIGDMIAQAVPKLAEMAGKFADWVIDALPGLLENLATYITSMLGWFIDHIPDIVKTLVEWGIALVGWIIPRIPKLLAALGTFLVKMIGWILTEGVPRLIKAALTLGGALVKGIMDFVTGADGGGGILKRLGDFITKTLIPGLLGFGRAIGKAALDLGAKLVNGVIDGLKNLGRELFDAFVRALKSIKIDLGPFHLSWKGIRIDMPDIKLPAFASGSWNVPFTGPAVIHRGEMVIPADLANRLRGGAGMGTGGAALAQGGGSMVIYVNIGDFHGTEENIRDLSRQLGEVVRYSSLRRAS